MLIFKCFPRELTDEQKSALAADITEVLIRHLNSKDGAVSVALQSGCAKRLAKSLG
ncbi:Tautomerase pptA [Raoultella planticola]|uniref:Tautomerase pptA n=1 Tax=Raoultella planticola TaxID=575 RepID=A0A485AMJ9_RAOPL|nr:Tautomerase pptA [Raoultella planticola]